MIRNFYRLSRILFFANAIAFTLLFFFTTALARQQLDQGKTAIQDEKEKTEQERRRMWRKFRQPRKSSPNRGNVAQKGSASVTPQPKSSSAAPSLLTDEDNFVGFTLWEMRESQGGSERRTFKKKKNNGQTVVMRPFRLSSEGALVAGERYFFSVESARRGYLYIIDRELLADGKLGEPLLLYPTKGGRDNLVAANELVEIPDQKTENASFEAEKHGQDHIGEVLTIIVSPKPLIDGSRLADEPITLGGSEVAEWERMWVAKSRWVENNEAIGQTYTEAEGRAGADPNVKLKESDPLPQRLYQIGARAGSPLIVRLQLRYSDSSK